MSVAAALHDAAAQLRASTGLRVVASEVDAHPPCVLLVATLAERLAAPGCWRVEVEARLIATPATPSWSWGAALDELAAALGVDTAEPGVDDDGSPFVAVRSTLQVTPDP